MLCLWPPKWSNNKITQVLLMLKILEWLLIFYGIVLEMYLTCPISQNSYFVLQ